MASQNKHLEHLEDELINYGYGGYVASKDLIQNFLDELGGRPTGNVTVTTKWDGAPAVVCGIDPESKQFFVGTKSVFNKKEPKVNFTEEDIDKNHGEIPDLAKKLKYCLKYFAELNINGIIQGDLLFTDEDVVTKTIDGERYYTATPNTLTYAWPADSDLGKAVNTAKIGAVFHTYYSGTGPINTLNAGFGVSQFNLKSTRNVFLASATMDNISSKSGLTTVEERTLKSVIAVAERNASAAKPFIEMVAHEATKQFTLGYTMKRFTNSYVKEGQKINNVNIFITKFKAAFKKSLDEKVESLKSEKSKNEYRDKLASGLQFLEANQRAFKAFIVIYNSFTNAKNLINNKLAGLSDTKVFLRSGDNFVVTKPEGFVAIVDGKAVKIVDRLEFSRANFTLEKSWRPPTTEGAKVAAFTFGRFNPPTTGHELLINKVKEFAAGNDYFVFPSHTTDKKGKNPLTAEQKVTLMKMMFPSHKDSVIFDADVRDAIKALKWLEDKGYTDAIFVVGSDRVPAFQFIKQYNGKDYNMNTVEIRSAGERDPDADDVSGMSASKVRKAIVEGDFDVVASALPNSVKNDASFKKMYIQAVLSGMS
jgi:nicotinic acid mononucleotide adenylyltransferase